MIMTITSLVSQREIFLPSARKRNTPLGAGPYKFVKYENKTVYLEANESYYKGAPTDQESSVA